MKHLLYTLLAPLLLLAACTRDPQSCQRTQQIYTPFYKTRAEVRSAMHSSPARGIDRSGKLYFYGNYIFLSDRDQGIHVIDNSNPAAPRLRAFLPVPGNVDIAIKDHFLYADSWGDLVVFNIGNPADIRPVTFLDNIFPGRNHYGSAGSILTDSTPVIAGYTVRDTTVACMEERSPLVNTGFALASSSGSGLAGSMARFALASGHLYTVDGNDLRSFSLGDPARPQSGPVRALQANGETVFPFGNSLFIGTTTGMHIYDIGTPEAPRYLSRFDHARVCDPVITDGTHAYVTLRSGGFCGGSLNELNVLRVTDLQHPEPVRTYPLSNPHGLALDGRLLFVCDGTDGLKVYDRSYPADLRLLEKITLPGTYDVIAHNGLLLLVAEDGLHQYAYSTGSYRPLQALSLLRTRH